MRKLFLITMASSALLACNVEPENNPGSGSAPNPPAPNTPAPNPPAPSSNVTGNGNVSAGKDIFEKSCDSCHKYEGQGFFGNVKVGNSDGKPFSIETLLSSQKYGSTKGLASYIQSSMPYGNAASCKDNCASDTAAYMASKLSDVNNQAPVAVAEACDANQPVTYGVRTLRPLTGSEYRNTIVQLGLVSRNEANDIDLPGDVVRTKSNYVVHSDLRIEGTRATAFDKAAFGVADIAAKKMSQQCGGNANSCADKFLELAFELHRQPLDQDEENRYKKMFNDFGAEAGMRTALAAALSSPQFIYRSEMGITVREAKQKGWNIGGNALQQADQDAYVLDSYEFASQLSFMYTGTGPSKRLLESANNGGLNSESKVQGVINDMVSSEAGRRHLEQFGGIWFRADDVVDETRPSFNDFTPQVAQDMSNEVRKLFAHVWYSNNLTLEDLYSGDFTVVNKRLANFYGHNNFNGGDNDWRVTEIQNRGGIVTTGAFHAAYANDLHTRPILKAVKLRELMLCHHIGAPQNMLAGPDAIAQNQAAIVSTLRDANGRASAREYYEASTGADGCQVCHAEQINPLFGMDDFDQVGRHRTSQTGLKLVNNDGVFEKGSSGVSVDSAGELIGLSDLNDNNSFSFDGSKDLGEKMASLSSVAECMIVNSFRYTTGLAIDRESVAKNGSSSIREDELNDEQVEDFACAKQMLQKTYESSGKKPMDVYRKIGTLDLIRFRK